MRRTAFIAMSMAMIGIAVGTALPQSITASVALLVAAACCLAIVLMRDPFRAPLHGLHWVVRLPLRTSVAVMVESFRSRLVGTLRAALRPRPQPTPIVLDEPDDEAEEWWGATAAPAPPARPTPWPPAVPSAPPLRTPVLAAPMTSAHVPAQPTRPIRARIAHLAMHARQRMEALAQHHGRSNDGAGAST